MTNIFKNEDNKALAREFFRLDTILRAASYNDYSEKELDRMYEDQRQIRRELFERGFKYITDMKEIL